MLAMYSVMYGVGGLGGSSALKIVKDMGPSKFRHAFYSQIVFLGLFFPIIPFLPETPCKWFSRRRNTRDNLNLDQGIMLENTNTTRRRRL